MGATPATATAAPSEVPPWPQDTQLGRDSSHNPQVLLLQEPPRAYCSFQGLQVCSFIYLLFKASVRVESSSFPSTFVAGTDLACQRAGVTAEYQAGRAGLSWALRNFQQMPLAKSEHEGQREEEEKLVPP